MSDLVKRLRIKAGMIEMGEMIAWGSDSALMREAADALELGEPVVQGEPVPDELPARTTFGGPQRFTAAEQKLDVAQAEQPSGVTALTSDLSARLNRVSRRSLDGNVIMSSEEWNGIVKLVEKLLTAAHRKGGEV